MNKRIRDFERESGLEIYGLGARREKWERALEKYAELIVRECARAIVNDSRLNDVRSAANGCVRTINEHFRVEESPGWVCDKCGTDRTKAECPLGHMAAIEGRCPMTVEAQ